MTSLLSSITIGGKVMVSSVVLAGLEAMQGEFTNMDVAAAFGRAGFAKQDLWIRQEAANRLLQRARKRDLIQFKKVWRATPALHLTVEADRNSLGL